MTAVAVLLAVSLLALAWVTIGQYVELSETRLENKRLENYVERQEQRLNDTRDRVAELLAEKTIQINVARELEFSLEMVIAELEDK